ncbi:MAG: transcriptional repressor LexA [Pseudomonadota bacterium]|nr:transcriptional repressor LexA [Gammaproteobacteria bacterium]MBU1629255.1 transcriptional repressor LexA [Gammaproteobacteria bacterium]MBU1927057.1 transcriptional repressor LexA [Gammaproteobacteria bacterium]MBU2545870.1 transcriptional repressor LexA [Gammaproteobacteria bacterium]
MLTIAQQKTLQFIQRFIKKNGYAPTVAEIATGIDIKSRGVVHRYIQALVAEGLIELTPNHHRNIRLIEEKSSKKIPLTGQLSDNSLFEKISNNQTIDVMPWLIGENRFALKVEDDGMLEEGIMRGDLLVCEPRDKIKDEDMVVALIDGKNGVLKRYQLNKDQTITLLPLYSRLRPTVYEQHRLEILGVYVGLIRLEK